MFAEGIGPRRVCIRIVRVRYILHGCGDDDKVLLHVIRRVSLTESTLNLTRQSSMSDIPHLLLESLNPQTRKKAEQSLEAYSRQPAFVLHLLRLVLDATQNTPVRLAASVYLKNTVKLGWLEDVCDLSSSLDQPL